MNRWILSLSFLLLTGAAWSNQPPTTGHPGNPDRGLAIYDAYCAGCHGFDGRGDGPMAARLSRDHGVRPTDLGNPAFQDSLTDEQLAHIIREGATTHRSGFMPAWGMTLKPEQLQDLVAFVRELKDPDRASPRLFEIQETLDLGRILYGLRCLACHGPEGRGDGPFLKALGRTARNLSDPEWMRRKSDLDLQFPVDQGPEHSKIPNVKVGWWEAPLQQDELRALLFFLRTLQMRPTP
ncbi:MAG: c-type cytochrome [Candidatus Eremiobacterota bacterium]